MHAPKRRDHVQGALENILPRGRGSSFETPGWRPRGVRDRWEGRGKGPPSWEGRGTDGIRGSRRLRYSLVHVGSSEESARMRPCAWWTEPARTDGRMANVAEESSCVGSRRWLRPRNAVEGRGSLFPSPVRVGHVLHRTRGRIVRGDTSPPRILHGPTPNRPSLYGRTAHGPSFHAVFRRCGGPAPRQGSPERVDR
eukprot:scaffold833_cov352-Pavlova_lutheri.AAC.26